jgi:hypothetical protein
MQLVRSLEWTPLIRAKESLRTADTRARTNAHIHTHTQIVLTRRDEELASSLLSAYLALFRQQVKRCLP